MIFRRRRLAGTGWMVTFGAAHGLLTYWVLEPEGIDRKVIGYGPSAVWFPPAVLALGCACGQMADQPPELADGSS